MSWYRTGTVTVTNGSTMITGAGTAFVGAVLAGHGFVGPDGRSYEVATVVSATQLTLRLPYLGSTQAGAAYGIFPTYAQLVSFNARLDQLLTDYQGFADGPGRGQFVDGTMGLPGVSFAADRDTGMRRIESNRAALTAGGADILEFGATGAKLNRLLTGIAVTQSATDATAGRLLKVGDFGLGTALPLTSTDNLDNLIASGLYYNSTAGNTPGNNYPQAVAGTLLNIRRVATGWTQEYVPFSGSGAASDVKKYIRSQSNVGWSPWVQVYTNANVVGTVSQTGGLPTGAVIERGSNANGEYVRFADGTQICTRSFDLGSIIANGSGTYASPYHTNPGAVTYSAAFVALPILSFSFPTPGGVGISGRILVTAGFDGYTTGLGNFRVARLSAESSAANAVGTLTAVGRWF